MPDQQTTAPQAGLGWIRSLVWSVFVVVAGVLLIASLRGGPMPTEVAPPLRGADLSGKSFELAQERGKPVVLYFWASWCGACKLTSPTVDQFARSHPDVTVVGVAMDEEADVRAYLREHDRHFPVLVASEQMQHDWPVRALPTTVVLDKAGRITWQRVGVLLPFELNFHID